MFKKVLPVIFAFFLAVGIGGCDWLGLGPDFIEPPTDDYAGLEDGGERIYNMEGRLQTEDEEETIEITKTENMTLNQESDPEIFEISIEYEWEEELDITDYYLGRDGDEYYYYDYDVIEEDFIERDLYLRTPINEGDELNPLTEGEEAFGVLMLLFGEMENGTLDYVLKDLNGILDVQKNAENSSDDDYLKAETQENIEVPAGEFEDAWRFSVAGEENGEEFNVTVWFVPELGLVKVDYFISVEEEEEEFDYEYRLELLDFDY